MGIGANQWPVSKREGRVSQCSRAVHTTDGCARCSICVGVRCCVMQIRALGHSSRLEERHGAGAPYPPLC